MADKRVAAAAWAIYSDFRRAQSGDPYPDRVWINRYIQRQTAVRYARVALAAADALESGDSEPGGSR